MSVAGVEYAQAQAEPPGLVASRGLALCTRAARLVEAGDRVSASAYFRDGIQADPSIADCYVGLARLELDRGETREARTVLEVGLRRAPSDWRVWLLLATTLDALGESTDADALLAEASVQFEAELGLLDGRIARAEALGRWSHALALTRRRLARCSDPAERVHWSARERGLRALVGELDVVASIRGEVGRALRAR